MIDPVTTRYTEALFHLAQREGVLETVERDVARLASELAAPGVEAFFLDARLSIEARRAKILPLVTGMHQLMQNFVALLFDKRRESVLRQLGEAFRQRALEERGAVEGVAMSARPLGAGELSELAVALGGRLGKSVTLKNEIDPELLGGVRVVVQSRMLDNSIRGRLDGLKKRMEETPLPSTHS